MGEDICKPSIFKGLTLKIYEEFIQLNSKTNENPQITQLKMGREPESTFFQRRHSVGQQVCEKALNITNH